MSTGHRRSVTNAQNFLRSRALVERLLEQSSIGESDTVVEIGPGRGLITGLLASRCRHVVAIEKDPELARRLPDRVGRTPNILVFEGDFLQFPLPTTPYKVFANIPFNITAAIVSKLTSGSSPPEHAYLVTQREAADKFLGWPRESLYAVLLKPWFEPTVLHHFRRTDFSPVPAVDVVLLSLARRRTPLVAVDDAATFRDLAVYVFAAWQPTVSEALGRVVSRHAVKSIERHLSASLQRPPSAVSFDDWLSIAKAFGEVADEDARLTIDGSEARLRRQQTDLRKVHRTRSAGHNRHAG